VANVLPKDTRWLHAKERRPFPNIPLQVPSGQRLGFEVICQRICVSQARTSRRGLLAAGGMCRVSRRFSAWSDIASLEADAKSRPIFDSSVPKSDRGRAAKLRLRNTNPHRRRVGFGLWEIRDPAG
jgi:hypothetical protein